MNKPYIKVLIKLLVSCALVLLVLSMIHVEAVLDAISRMNVQIIVSVCAVYVFYMTVGALKWKILLPDYSFRKLLRFTLVGQFYGLILPGQLTGEMAKGYRLAREAGEGPRITASIFVDKITAFGALVCIGIIGCVFSAARPPFFAILIIAGFALILLGFLYAARFKSFFMRVLMRMRIPENIILKIDLFLSHYNQFSKSARVICLSICMGVVSQCVAIFMNMMLAQSVGVTIGIFEWFWLFAITSFVTLLPITIGGLGIRETVFAASALALNVRPSLTVAISLMMYVFQIIFAAIGGLLELKSFMRKKI